MKPANPDAFRRCLAEGDVEGLAALFARHHPHLPQPLTSHEREVQFHLARTATHSVPALLRQSSRQWLTGHGYPVGV